MKRLCVLLAVMSLLFACKEGDIPVYDDVSYVQFAHKYTDSISFSFFLYPTQKDHVFPLTMKLSGMPLQEDGEFVITVLEESTAKSKHYDLPKQAKFKANQALDTLNLVLHKVPGLESTPVRLVLEIQGKGNLLPGQLAYTRKIIWLSNSITKPTWWDKTFTRSFLGEYTDKKFSEFIRIVETGDLAGMEPDRIRALCLKFKAELLRLKNAGTPVLEADGADMLNTIPILG